MWISFNFLLGVDFGDENDDDDEISRSDFLFLFAPSFLLVET